MRISKQARETLAEQDETEAGFYGFNQRKGVVG